MQFKNTICEDVLKGLLSLSDTDPSPRLDILKVCKPCLISAADKRLK
jgi:hypothetical protein